MQFEIPSMAKACVLTAPGAFEIRDVPVPKPGFGEVLCRIGAVAICGSDPKIVRGDLAGTWPPSYPFIAGHEWAGTVVALGEGVTGFTVGDRVAGEAHKGCGACKNCREGRYTLCLNYGKTEAGHAHYGFRVPGAYAQYQKFSIRSLTKMPKNVTFAEASMCDTAGCALHGVELVGIEAGDTVAVIGPGPIGLCAMLLAKRLGAGRTIMIGRGARLAFAGQLGADHLIDMTQQDPVSEVLRLTEGIGADVVLECSGAEGTLHQSIRMVKKGGRISCIGTARVDLLEKVPFQLITDNEILIIGSRANPNTSGKVMELIAGGDLPVGKLITHRFPLEQFGEAFDTFVQRKGNAVKVVIFPNGEEAV